MSYVKKYQGLYIRTQVIYFVVCYWATKKRTLSEKFWGPYNKNVSQRHSGVWVLMKFGSECTPVCWDTEITTCLKKDHLFLFQLNPTIM